MSLSHTRSGVHKLVPAIVLSALCLGALIGLTGCASMGAANMEQLLSASGFNARKPETRQQEEIYRTMPPYKLQSTTVDGKPLYVYKHEKKGLLYIGGETQFQQYQRLSLQQDIARQNLMAAQMNQDLALRWNYWGPRGPWW